MATNPEVIDGAEYDELFPFEQEYNAWMESLERDYREELEHRAAIKIRARDTVSYDPFETINS